MRLYSFTHTYLSSLQKGLQTAHLVHELFEKYSNRNTILNGWAKDHKTIIILKGGNSLALEKLNHLLSNLGNELSLPQTHFYEDENSLNHALTCTGIVVPAHIYDKESTNLSWNEMRLSEIIKTSQLA